MFYANRSGAAGRLARFWGKIYRDHEDHDDTHQEPQDSHPASGTHPHHLPSSGKWLTAYVLQQRPAPYGAYPS